MDCLQKGLNLDWNTVPGGRVGLSSHTVFLPNLSQVTVLEKSPQFPILVPAGFWLQDLRTRKGKRVGPRGIALVLTPALPAA